MLERLTEQRFRRIQAPEVLIIVADNEGSARMHALCAKFVAAHGLRLVYLVVKIIQKSPAAIRLERREPPR